MLLKGNWRIPQLDVRPPLFAVLSNPPAKVGGRLGIRAVDVAALHALGHQGPIRVLDGGVDLAPRFIRLSTQLLLVALDGLILSRTLLRYGHDRAVACDQIRADNDTDGVHLQSMAGADAPDLLD